jgi:hypothetical protein
MTRANRFVFHLGLLLALLPLVGGCGGGAKKIEVPRYKASGTVLVGGKPLAELELVLFAEDQQDTGAPKTSVARPSANTKEDGTFSLSTGGNDGAPAGKYIMTVKHFGKRGLGVTTKTGSGSPVAAKYGAPETSPLRITIDPIAENQLGTIEIP